MNSLLNLTLQRPFTPTLHHALQSKIRQLVSNLVWTLLFTIPSFTNAQSCSPQADFSFVVNGCNVTFQPFNNSPGVMHFWTFETLVTGSLISSTNIASPTHTFGAETNGFVRIVTHTVTIGGVNYTCTKQLYVYCTTGCDDRYFSYAVNGCTVTFFSTFSNQNWDFGNGNTSNQTNPTFTYSANGDYTVTFTIPGTTTICQKTIRVACGQQSDCCTAAFTAEVKRECSVLKLSLNAQCTVDGTHTWTVTPFVPTACMTLVNFVPNAPNQGMIQLTNINTCEVTHLTIRHRYICRNGNMIEQTQVLPIPVQAQGIYIGRDGATTQLTDYNCVLPGAIYNGPCTVYSSGIVNVNKVFTFSSANVRVQPGLAGFDVISNFTLNQNTLVSGNAEPECNCLWRGIYVYGATMMTTSTNASIQDALYAIRANYKNFLDISNTLFSKNFIGIRGTDGNFQFIKFEGNTFDGFGPLKEICTLDPLKQDIVAPSNGNPLNQPIVPVVYQSQRGFSGLYLVNYNLNLNPLSFGLQNKFLNTAYGIMAYDGNVSITQNSIFQNIAGGTYGDRRSAGILFVDRQPQGPNTFKYIGNGQSGIDFLNCVQGMHIRSEQAVAPTKVGITYANMSGVRTGIFLDARFGGGEFFGTGLTGDFIGIKHNSIIANLNAPTIVSNGGITFNDNSLGFSNVDISENTVELSYLMGGQGGSTGIASNGASPASDPGPAGVEVDIHDNRVVINGGDFGIGGQDRPNCWIRNNSGGNIASGNGIFISGANVQSGLVLRGAGGNKLVACNDVTVQSGVLNGLLDVWSNPNGLFLRNILTGPGNGAHFQLNCNNVEFRCNEMVNNTLGLLYDNAAVTGDQGTTSITNGNTWIGTFPSGGATADGSVIFSSSKYFVRGAVNEMPPPPVTPLFGTTWFFSALPTATINCSSDDCPADPPMALALPSQLSSFDTLVAQGRAIPNDAPFAEERAWQDDYILWNKLKDYPGLVQENVTAQNYLNGLQGSNIEAFWDLQSNIRRSLVPGADVSNQVQSYLNSIQQTEAQILSLQAQAQLVSDPGELSVFAEQVSVQEMILDSLIRLQEGTCVQFETQRTSSISDLLTQLNLIMPSNLCESNLKTAYEIYLRTFASNLLADSSQLAQLELIAMQCPLEGGPGVSLAGALFQGFIGILPAQGTCEENGERKGQKTLKNEVLSLYPNPNAGSFVVNIPQQHADQHSLLRIFDAQGRIVKEIAVLGERTIDFSLVDQPNGLYFVSLIINGKVTAPLSFTIQH